MSDMLLGGKNQRISELEPFIMQLPSSLPLDANEQTDFSSIMDKLSLVTKEPKPVPFGKILVMKSGKVVLRVPSSEPENSHIDYILSKGIATNFY